MAAPEDHAAIRRWLDAFAAAVRAADYARGAELFDPDALGFGTVVERAEGLNRLAEAQWKRVWDATEGFAFHVGGARIEVRGDIAWVASTWSSTGVTEGGAPFPRSGRATIVLRRRGDGWRAVHTHFSLTPGDAR
jgi:ketosteroid isomerase-like protein